MAVPNLLLPLPSSVWTAAGPLALLPGQAASLQVHHPRPGSCSPGLELALRDFTTCVPRDTWSQNQVCVRLGARFRVESRASPPELLTQLDRVSVAIGTCPKHSPAPTGLPAVMGRWPRTLLEITVLLPPPALQAAPGPRVPARPGQSPSSLGCQVLSLLSAAGPGTRRFTHYFVSECMSE